MSKIRIVTLPLVWAAICGAVPGALAQAGSAVSLVCKTFRSAGHAEMEWPFYVDLSRSVVRLGNAQAPAQITETQIRFRLRASDIGMPSDVDIHINRLTGDFYQKPVNGRDMAQGRCTRVTPRF